MTLKPVELHKAYRLINHGPTVMVSAEFDGVRDVMSASWVCPLDYDKLTAVIGAFRLAGATRRQDGHDKHARGRGQA